MKIASAASVAVALCSGSFAVAAASLRPAVLGPTQAIGACADGSGYLRLATTAEKCATGQTKVGLARSSTAPQALALYATSGAPLTKTLSLIANTQLEGVCAPGSNGSSSEATLVLKHNGKTQIDGTSYVVESGDGNVDFATGTEQHNNTPTGASNVYATQSGAFDASAGVGGSYATGELHLLVTVPGAVFTIDAVIDANGSPYCRVTAEVETAATS
jgi:hypothetical protein